MRVIGKFSSFLLAAFLVLGSAGCAAQTGAASEPEYQPQQGQPGKDVIWVPTPVPLVQKMLTAAKVTPQDRVYDLGAGDGIIAITAARQFGAQAVGIEYNPQMADHARRKVREAGVADKVRIITGDIFQEDFSQASVVTLYLLPELNMRLRPTLLAMRPGTRVVSHAFDMGEWTPDENLAHENTRAFLWIVPARVEGEWQLSGVEGDAPRIQLRQSFQNVTGSLVSANATQPLASARLRGDELSFQFSGPDGQPQQFSGRVNGNRASGMLQVAGQQRPVELTRR